MMGVKFYPPPSNATNVLTEVDFTGTGVYPVVNMEYEFSSGNRHVITRIQTNADKMSIMHEYYVKSGNSDTWTRYNTVADVSLTVANTASYRSMLYFLLAKGYYKEA